MVSTTLFGCRIYTESKNLKVKTGIKYLLFIVMLFFAFTVKGQDNKYEEFIIKEKIYKPGCSWLKFGVGVGYNWKHKENEQNLNLAFSFRAKNTYIQAGYHVSSDEFVTKGSGQKLNDIYVALGKRKETLKYNLSIFGGPSFAYGANFDHYSVINGVTSKWYKGFSDIGLFASAEYTYKLFYDMGLGVSIYSSINKNYFVSGIQLHIYFSGAFKGQIK